MMPLCSIYSLARGSGEGLTVLSANVSPNAGRHPASEAILCSGPGLVGPGILPQALGTVVSLRVRMEPGLLLRFT